MRMSSEYEICACINRGMRQLSLKIIQSRYQFNAPVEMNNDQICSVLFRLSYGTLDQIHTFKSVFQRIDANECSLDSIQIHIGDIFSRAPVHASRIHRVLRILCTLVAVVIGVVIRKRHNLYAAFIENLRKGRVRLECERFVLPVALIQGCQRSFEIRKGRVILTQDRLHLLEEITVAVHRLISIEAGILTEIDIRSQCAVTDRRDRHAPVRLDGYLCRRRVQTVRRGCDRRISLTDSGQDIAVHLRNLIVFDLKGQIIDKCILRCGDDLQCRLRSREDAVPLLSERDLRRGDHR